MCGLLSSVWLGHGSSKKWARERSRDWFYVLLHHLQLPDQNKKKCGRRCDCRVLRCEETKVCKVANYVLDSSKPNLFNRSDFSFHFFSIRRSQAWSFPPPFFPRLDPSCCQCLISRKSFLKCISYTFPWPEPATDVVPTSLPSLLSLSLFPLVSFSLNWPFL